MDAKELAQKLNGRKYGCETIKEDEIMAREHNLVIVYGQSDDIVQVQGALSEEFGDVNIFFNKNGFVKNECDEEYCPYFEKIKLEAARIQPEYCNYPDMPNGWGFRVNNADGSVIPSETFEIMEDGEVYCKGIVFSIDSLA